MEREKIMALTQAPVAEVVVHLTQLVSALKDQSLQQVIATLPFYSKMVVANAVEQIAITSGDL